jgi:hypothetical protein
VLPKGSKNPLTVQKESSRVSMITGNDMVSEIGEIKLRKRTWVCRWPVMAAMGIAGTALAHLAIFSAPRRKKLSFQV